MSYRTTHINTTSNNLPFFHRDSAGGSQAAPAQRRRSQMGSQRRRRKRCPAPAAGPAGSGQHHQWQTCFQERFLPRDHCGQRLHRRRHRPEPHHRRAHPSHLQLKPGHHKEGPRFQLLCTNQHNQR